MDFDDAKENIQPLATGRNASILQASLRNESPQELQAQRKELEQAIHNYDGDDPLEVWYDYVTWIEQSFPSGGKESGLEEVLTKCLTYFEHETRYHQDRRLIKLYIKFIDMHKNPTECYQQLVSEGIGTMVADLYISWAYCYDLCGNYKKANEIFRRGIACRAQPLDELQEAHQHFCFIVSQRFLYKDDVNETEMANQELNERRLVLSSLRSHRKKVGSIRTGTAVKSYVPGTVQIDANTSTRRCNAKVNVFSDENQNPNFLLPPPTPVNDDNNPEEEKKSVTRCIIDATRDLENQKEPGPWNKAHDKKKGKLFTKNTTILGFNILEDNATTSEKRANTKEIVIEKPFKPFPNFVSKNRPQPDWPTPVTIENETKPRSYPQYNKCKLYPRPNMEFQLEELLAYNWFRKRGITNDFTQRRDAVWQNNNESIQPLRQYPNFAKSSRKQTANSLDTFCAPEKINAMKVNYNDIYNIAEKQEYQFEEILYKRWQNGERKLRYDANDTIIIATEMEETICMPQDVPTANRRKSFFPARKSMFKKIAPQVQAMEAFVESADIDVPKLTNDAVLRTDSIVNSKQNTLPSFADEKTLQKSMENFKIYDDYYDAPSTSKAAAAAIKKDVAQEASSITVSKTLILPTAVLQNSFEFKAPAPPPTINIFNKIPFEIYTETEVDQFNVPTTTENVGFFEADETCNTQAFTCFIKPHSVSTPNPTQKVAPRMFGTILKEKTEPIPEVLPSAFMLESNAEVATATGSTTSLSPVVTKQLSTILETSEHGTTKSISSPEYETDTKMSMGGRLGATTQHTANLETVKEQSCEISTRTEQFLCNTLPPKSTADIVMVNSSQVEPSSAATEAPRLASNYFAIFEDPTATGLADNKHVGNFSRLEEREDTTTAAGYVVRPIKFQEDKTETIPCIMQTLKQNVVKFQDDKTETLPKIFTPSLLKFEDEKNADTLSKLPPIKMPEKIDDSFNFFIQTPPKFSKSMNNQTSMLSTNELLGFDSENSPVSGGATAAKLKCNYNTPELREKMSFMRQYNDNSSFVPATQPTQQPKLSFMSDFSLIAETQPTTMQPKVLSFIKDSQPLLASSSSSKMREQQAAALHDSFELPDFSIVMDSQPATQNAERKWKQNQSTRPLDISSVMDSQPTQNVATKWKQNQNTPPPSLELKCKEHILTDSFMKDFSSIKDPLPEPAFSKFFAEKPISNLSKLKLSENVQDKSMQKVNTSEVAKAPLSTSDLIDGNTTKNDVAVDNFIKPALAYDSSKKMHASPFAVNVKPTDELFEYNAETAQFATNLSMIRNSTLLSKETHKRQTQFQDKSLHIKDEQQSLSGNSFDSSYKIFKSPPLPLAASSQARKSIAQKTSKVSFLNAAATTQQNAVAPAAELSSNSLRFSIDLSSDEVATLQMAKQQKNSSKQSSSSFAIEFKTPTEKSEPKIIRIDSSEEIDEQHASDDADADDYDNEMSIYVKQTPKTPKYQRHVWHNEPAQSEDEEGSNHFVHPECDLNQTQQCIENICSDGNVNPFNTDLINAFLEKVDFVNYIKQLPECVLVGRVKQLHKDSIVKVNDTQFKVLKLVGEGSYGAIFCATECKTGKKYALKQERPANYWEYYICLELRSRLPVDELAAAFMIVDYALVGNNASILISQFSTYGSLIAVCNKIKKATMKNVDEYVVMHLTCQLLEIIDHLHAAGIIHADIKADNFLLMEKLSYDRNHISLMLIDFGVSIDTRFFKNGQNFTFVHKDNAMKCIEMRENRPWTYQLDLYGLAGVIHVLLFGKYMDVEKNANGFWMHKTHVPRYLKKLLWEKVFKSLLNVRDCAYTSMPNLQNLRTLLKEEIAENENGVIKKIFDFNRALES